MQLGESENLAARFDLDNRSAGAVTETITAETVLEKNGAHASNTDSA
jgi:hypothetical protein